MSSLLPFLAASRGLGCPVCGDVGVREAMVEAIVAEIQLTGRFAVSGLVPFWVSHSTSLCQSCRLKLGEMGAAKKRALPLLAEAVKLDPKNDAAKSNLEALRRMT
jgi:hypothetical protein